MRMNTYCKLDYLYKKRKGYIGTRELMEEGFSNRQIAVLTEEDYLEKVCYGYYWMKQCGCKKPDDYKCIEVCLSNPRAAITMKSAWYYQGALPKEPEIVSVATARTDRSAMKLNFPIERHYFSNNNFQAGLKRVETEFGSYNIYDMVRSLCDVVRIDQVAADDEIILEMYNRVTAEHNLRRRLLIYTELLKIKNMEEKLTQQKENIRSSVEPDDSPENH